MKTLQKMNILQKTNTLQKMYFSPTMQACMQPQFLQWTSSTSLS